MFDKFNNSLPAVFDNEQTAKIIEAFADQAAIDQVSVADFMTLFETPPADIDSLLA